MRGYRSVWLVITVGGALVLLSGWVWYAEQVPSNQSPVLNMMPVTSDEVGSTEERVRVVAENLDTPWGIAFLPDRAMLVTERPGRVRLVTAEGKLASEPVATLAQVQERGEGGLLGIALDPDFSANANVYLYYTYREDQGNTLNRVVRMDWDNTSLQNEEVIVDKIPGALYHNGGRIKFGPDGYLYITTGDAQDSSRAQDINSLAGKILRVTKEGEAAPDNPFGNMTYSFGHRNPQGLDWDRTGNLWATEHGRSGVLSGFDELNLIKGGANYGWPEIQGDEQKEGMETPAAHSESSTTWAPAGAAYINGKILFGGLRGEALYQADISGQPVKVSRYLAEEFGRIREVVTGPDGYVYITTSNQDGRGNPSANDDRIVKVKLE